MKLVIFICLAVFGKVSLKTRTHTEEQYWEDWQNFLGMDEVVQRVGGYASQQEHDIRFEIFKDNMEKIEAHNQKNISWRMALNQFADMTPSEFKKYTSCLMNGKPASTELFTPQPGVTVPDSVDWVAKGDVTPVKNQGACGSCWAFSTTGSIESRAAIAGGGLISLSEQDLVDCSKANNGCSGGLMDYAFEFVIGNGGLCTEADYAYTGKDGTCKTSCTKHDPISSYVDVESSTEALEQAIAAGPVSIAIEADQWAFQLYSSGVFTGTCGTSLDHGVLAVGYGTMNGQDYWRVKNSWGSGWGDEGYIYLCRNCDANEGKGQCGILMSASYPVV